MGDRLERLSKWICVKLMTRLAVKQAGWGLDQIEPLIRKEVELLPAFATEAIEYTRTEADITADRLSRLYDIGPAMNEATNRAVVLKQKAKQEAEGVFPLTGRQKMALEYQKNYLKGLVKSA